MAPGVVAGRLTIWAYDDSTGNLYSYPIALVNGVPALSGDGTPIGATSGPVVFTYGSHGDNPVVASPGPLANSSYPGIAFATPPGSLDPAGSVCGNGCLWYFPGQSTSGGASPLNSTPVFIGALDTAVTQLS